jgi:hypothetical protein
MIGGVTDDNEQALAQKLIDVVKLELYDMVQNERDSSVESSKLEQGPILLGSKNRLRSHYETRGILYAPESVEGNRASLGAAEAQLKR